MTQCSEFLDRVISKMTPDDEVRYRYTHTHTLDPPYRTIIRGHIKNCTITQLNLGTMLKTMRY